ncbi:TPA: dihydropyrimidinase [Candidatus Acetothermia bacterium]|nr:dihydropyrimidinase [Candidatus Acetothermia bacterium]
MSELVIRGARVVTPQGVREADVLIRDGKIARVGRVERPAEAFPARGLLLLPGAIDAHVHLALPVAGTRSADDFESGTLAAAAGGVTTIVDFTVGAAEKPLPVAIEGRLEEARKAAVDFSLHAEMIGWTPARKDELFQAALLGVRSFKFYMAYGESGRRTPLDVLKAAMERIARLGGVAMVHAEAEELVDPREGPTPEGRPAIAEEVAIAELGILALRTGCLTYVAHISSTQGLSTFLTAKERGAPLMGETCPHYLVLDESVYTRPDGYLYSVTPPLRGSQDQEALWLALSRRQLHAVSTDHCPFTRAQKEPGRDDPTRLPSGLPGVETLLPLLYSEGVAKGRISLSDLVWYLAEGPARAFGLWPKKGGIQEGADADLVLLDPKATWTVTAKDLHMATDFSPYEGLEVQGRIVGVLSRGEWLVRDGELLAQPGWGEFVPWRGGGG